MDQEPACARSWGCFESLFSWKAMNAINFEQMATELERIAAQIRGRSESNQSFADRIELLAKQMRQEVDLRVIRGKKG